MSPIPPRGSIPGRKPRGLEGLGGLGDLLKGAGSLTGSLLEEANNLLGGVLKSLGKTVEGIQNLEDLEKLDLEALEKLAEAQGNEEAKANIKELKEKLGKMGEKGINLGDLFGQGLDLSKLIEFATKHGGEFSKKFAGGQGIIKTGVRGRRLGRPFGGDLPLDRRGSGFQGTKFEVKGTRPTKTKTTETPAPQESQVREIEIDPTEEDGNHLILRGYLAGVAEEDIICEVLENGTVLKISTTGERKYEKKVELLSKVTKKVKWSYKNGVLEVVLNKRKAS